ncbi:SMI1/KNR4 family protein [Microbulbifer sp. EKSA005]|uniref:SMI1/KNR4 family protein n=2 Tax=unclassified Microbulbifer TaxID=2619833 RepID=UPI00404203BD
MDIKDYIELIHSFSKTDFELQGGGNSICFRLQKERDFVFPKEFQEYMVHYAPAHSQYLDGVGNPIDLYSARRLSWVMNGYNYNPVDNQPIPGWDKTWFLFADEGADPIIVDLAESNRNSKVYRAMHGAGGWDFRPIADSIGQFLLCASALHHALSGIVDKDVLVDDGCGFNLHERSASWLFPFFRQYADKYYTDWLAVFDNS